MLKTESVGLLDQYTFNSKGIRELTKQLDQTNIRILSAMWKLGPRNLLEVSRQTGMPFTSVYHRISRIESKSKEIAIVIAQVAKLGMVRVAVLLTANPGCEDLVTAALKIPNLWRSVGTCEGTFTHISMQLVPIKFLKEFRSYIQHLAERKLIRRFTIVLTGDYLSNFPDFQYYDSTSSRWKFDWEGWLAELNQSQPLESIDDPPDYPVLVDKKDLLLIEELEKDARVSFTDLAPMLGMSLQGVKYHFDKLVPTGIIDQYQFKVVPYSTEVAAYHEIMLEFNSKNDMDKFYSLVPKLFFVLGVAKVLRRNTLMVQTYMLQSQVANMFSFFSTLARTGLLKSYSSVRLNFGSRETQTISSELFDDEKGWNPDLEKSLAELSNLQTIGVKA